MQRSVVQEDKMEILSLDLLYCHCDNFNGKRSTLRAVRLVNRTLAAAAAPFLFQTLLVHQTPRSWERLCLIARCPWLAKHVVKLLVAALHYLPHHLDFLDWKKGSWALRWNHAYDQNVRAAMVALLLKSQETRTLEKINLDRHMRLEVLRQHPEVRKRSNQLDMGIVAHLSSEYRGKTDLPVKIPPSNLELALGLVDGYERYRYWHDGEDKLSDLLCLSRDPQHLLDLVPLPNLQTGAVLTWHQLWTRSTWEADEANRKFRESCVYPFPRDGVKTAQNNVHMSLALRMLDASEVYITRIELHKHREILRDAQFSVPPLKKLQELVLDLSHLTDYEEVLYYRGRWELPVWLQGADDLQTVIISFRGPNEDDGCWYFDVIALFHGAEWPKLQCVNLKETFVRPKSLLQFLSEHTRSLKSIHVEKPKISKVAWQSLASEFQALEFNSPPCIPQIDIPDQCGDIDPWERLEHDSDWIDGTNRPYHHM